MRRPLGGRASGAGPVEASEERAARQSEGGAPRRAARRDAEVARLTGIAVHRVFERLDLDAPVELGLGVSEQQLASWLRSDGAPEPARAAARCARELLDRLAGGSLVARLERLRSHVVARELPVLLPAAAGDEALAFVAGAVDLVYCDPDSEEWVVVDYKTDVVAPDVSVESHAAGYAGQGAVYQRALREGLGLAREPRFDLWFLASDRCVTLADGASAAPAQLSLTLARPGE
jgi:ATP-dependent exoDNAse (exonuclease V) beta subunit